MTTVHDYPVHVEANLDRPLSRWLWLVKWVLAIIKDLPGRRVTTVDGTAVPRTAPGNLGIWVARSDGQSRPDLDADRRRLDGRDHDADASGGVTVRGEVGATVPALTGIAVGLLIGAVALLAGGC